MDIISKLILSAFANNVGRKKGRRHSCVRYCQLGSKNQRKKVQNQKNQISHSFFQKHFPQFFCVHFNEFGISIKFCVF
jgi:hypothetical protein